MHFEIKFLEIKDWMDRTGLILQNTLDICFLKLRDPLKKIKRHFNRSPADWNISYCYLMYYVYYVQCTSNIKYDL